MKSLLKKIFHQKAETSINKKLSLVSFHSDWNRLVEKWLSNKISLNNDEKVWFYTQQLLASIDNGGLVSFYYNSGADNIEDTLTALSQLEAYNLIEQIEKFNGLFPGIEKNNDLDRRNEIINSWGELEVEIQNTIEEKIILMTDDIEDKLVQYIIKKQLSRI